MQLRFLKFKAILPITFENLLLGKIFKNGLKHALSCKMITFGGVFFFKYESNEKPMLRQVIPNPRNYSLVLYRVKMGVAATAAATVVARAANQIQNSNDFQQR